MDTDKNISFESPILNVTNALDPQEECSHYAESACNNTIDFGDINNQEDNINYNVEKNSAVWTSNATLTLLKLYEEKLEMLETPKKKTRIWMAISEALKDYSIEMSPDQVRWKINALTKKYKQSIDCGQHNKFRYFKEMNRIYSQFNVDNDAQTISELLQKKKRQKQSGPTSSHKMSVKSNDESKAMIEVRKTRLAVRMESDRTQRKIHLENQWLEYLKRQEEQKLSKDEVDDKNLQLKEKELELCKKAIEIKNSIDLRKMDMWERKQETLLSIEREKFEMLKKFFAEN